MAVYLTKNMLSKLNQFTYPLSTSNEEEGTSGDHWQTLFMDGNSGGRLATDMICRVCAKKGCTPLTYRLNEYDVMSALRSITNVTVDVDDSLPKYICAECLESVKSAMALKKTCEASDQKFRKILNPLGVQTYPYSKHDFQLILHQMKLKRLKYEQKLMKARKKKDKSRQKRSPATKIKEFRCSPCDMTFPNKEILVEHRRERQCMRRACELCGQLVLSITQHMRQIHKASVPHKCTTCGKEFPIVARLKNHMLVHSDTFNFFCDLCPYKCKHKYYLVMHMRTHTGEKPYQCPHCPATFVNPSNLNKHKLTHQEKQFKCMLCEKAFRTNTALREHQQATHMNIKHRCLFCGRDFCYKSDLRKHEIRNHNRSKRNYIGGEPTYKQVERMQKLQDCNEEAEKWRIQEVAVTQPVPVVQTAYIEIDQRKEYLPPNQALYYSDVTGMLQQQQPQLIPIQQQTVQLTLPELLKKDPAKMYEPQQGIGYF